MAQCSFPYHVENPRPFSQDDTTIPVPCGRCPECLKRRSTIWGYRLRKEEERSDSALFVTLTYDSLFVPLTENGFMTLAKRDVQLFFKRLRKLAWQKDKNGKTIKYYIAGEYGSARRRPHYHAIIFNTNELDVLKAWIHPYQNLPLGQVDIGTVSGASIAYTVKYINKGRWKPMHKNDDRLPEFSLMSKRLGDNYITPNTVKFHRNDISKAYITLEDGIRMSIPRYYKQKIFPSQLSPTEKHSELIYQHPSILIHLLDNEKLLKQQNDIVKKIIAEQKPELRSDKEVFEAKRAQIQNFQRKYKQRKDL